MSGLVLLIVLFNPLILGFGEILLEVFVAEILLFKISLGIGMPFLDGLELGLLVLVVLLDPGVVLGLVFLGLDLILNEFVKILLVFGLSVLEDLVLLVSFVLLNLVADIELLDLGGHPRISSLNVVLLLDGHLSGY